jgi:hypothetical protein
LAYSFSALYQKFVEKGEEEQDEEGDTLLEALDAANLADLDEFEVC